jgi:hypothetical protein
MSDATWIRVRGAQERRTSIQEKRRVDRAIQGLLPGGVVHEHGERISDLELDRMLDSASQRLADRISRAVGESKVVVVDLLHDETFRPSSIEQIVSTAFQQVEFKILVGNALVIVLVRDSVFADNPRVAALSEAIEGDKAGFLAEDGSTSSSLLGGSLQTFATGFRAGIDDHREEISKRILRRRGVFEAPESDDTFLKFRFSAADCNEHVAGFVEEFVRGRLAELGIERERVGVVSHCPISPWLAEAANTACSRIGALRNFMSYDIGVDQGKHQPELSPDDLDVASDAKALLPEMHLVIVLVSLVKTGRSLDRVIQAVRDQSGARIECVAVLWDGHRLPEIPREFTSEAGEPHALAVASRAKQEILTSSDWRVAAARQTGEIEVGLEEYRAPSALSMWSLFDDVGLGLEYPKPERRKALLRFPRLNEMDERDAHWLSDAMIKAVQFELEISPDRLVAVVPSEDSGVSRLRDALRDALDIEVVELSRAAIDGIEESTATKSTLPSDFIEALGAHKLKVPIILDESTVTYSTIRAIESAVQAVLHVRPKLAMVALEAERPGSQRPLTPVHSFSRWMAVEGGESG